MIKSVNLDEKTIQRLDTYGREHSLSRSAVIRLAVSKLVKEVT